MTRPVDAPRPRVLGIAGQDPTSPTTLSGVPKHLFDALQGPCDVVGRLSYGPTGAQRPVLAGATMRPDRTAWRARFRTGPLAERVHARNLRRALRASPAEFDFAVQVFGWVTGHPCRYVLYVDQTRRMAERGWPSWMPIDRGSRERVLAREAGMLRSAAHVFTMSADARDAVIAEAAIDPARATVVGAGVNFDRLPVACPPAASPTILFVGKDWERKGGPDLVSAFREVRRAVPAARLEVVGPRLRLDCAGVTVHGRLGGREAIASLYRRARVFCMPSHYEPWGLAFAEAMAFGRPCVGTSVQAVPDIVGPGGVVVAPGDRAALAEALVALLTDDSRARAVGAAARRRAEEHLRWAHVAEKMAPVLTDLARS